MSLFNGKGGLIAKISASVGLVAAILVLYWQIGDRLDKRRGEAIAASEIKIMVEVNKADVELANLIEDQRREGQEQQRRNNLRYWTQERDRAKIELRRVQKGLVHHPNDRDLLEESEYWQEMYNQAKRELNKLLNP